MLIEAVRLVVTLAFTAAGFVIGRSAPDTLAAALDQDTAIVVGAVIGAGIGYVVGGLVGRLIRRGVDRAPDIAAARASGPQLFAGAFGLLAGLVVGVVAGIPLVVLLPQVVGWTAASLVVIVLAALGSRVFAARSEDLLAVAGLGVGRSPAPSDAVTYLVDTSAAIDGRILDLVRAGLVRGEVVAPGFVIDELQGIADAGDRNRRRRGRRGLDVLAAVRDTPGVSLRTDVRGYPEHLEVDAKLIAFAADSGATLVTTDHNLGQAAGLRGIAVLDPQALGESLRAGPLAGDRLEVLIEKEGTELGQGVGYLDDGTMIVIEDAAARVGSVVEVEVVSALRTSVGKMLFGRLGS